MIDLTLFFAGDEECWDGLVTEFGPLVLDIVRRYANDEDEANDWYQDAWARAFRKRRSFQGSGSLSPWLTVLTRNVCLNCLKSQKRRVEISEQLTLEVVERPADPLARLVTTEAGRLLQAAIVRLPRRQRQAISLRLKDDQATSKIARIMGVSDATVRSLVSKGIARLSEDMRIAG